MKKNVLTVTIFILIIAFFTGINVYECIGQKEELGRKKGLAYLSTAQDTGVSVWGGLQKLMGKRQTFGATVYEDVYSMGEGYYAMPDPSEDINIGIEGIRQGRKIADSLDIPFLFVFCPPKQNIGDDIANNTVDYAYYKCERMSKWLPESDINYVNMYDVFTESGEDYHSYFYKTDHHCNNKGAFLIFQKTAEAMRSLGFNVNEEYMNPDSYESVHYDKVFLGSSGRMTGPLYSGLDDYDLLLPKFETSMTLETQSQGIERSGSFEDALVYYENLNGYSYDYYAYYAYLHEDYDFTRIINHNCKDGPHVAIVRDSSAVPVSCFLANMCSEIDLISLRYVDCNRDAIDYLKDSNPDMIIYMFGVGFLGNEDSMLIENN